MLDTGARGVNTTDRISFFMALTWDDRLRSHNPLETQRHSPSTYYMLAP